MLSACVLNDMLQAAVPRSPPVWNPTADAPGVREFLVAWQGFCPGRNIEAETRLPTVNAEDMMDIEREDFLFNFLVPNRSVASLLYKAIHPSK